MSADPALPKTNTDRNDTQERKYFSLFAGAASGFVSTIALQPLDVVKTRVQVAPSSERKLLSAFQYVIKTDGAIGLWKGTVPTLIRTVPGISLYFYTLQLSKKIWATDLDGTGLKGLTPWRAFAAGFTARGALAFALLPLTVVKTRFESGVYNYKGVSQALVNIYKTESLRGLFSGATATVLRDAPFSGIYYSCYEHLRHTLSGGNATPTALTNLTSGLMSGVIATCITQPPDIVRARMQLNPVRYTKTFQSLRLIMSEEGWRGLTRGMTARVLRKSITTGVTWTIYEEAVLYLAQIFPK